MTKRRASTYIPSEWSFYCPSCKNNKHLEWNRKKEMIQCDACSSLFPGPSCKYCPCELSRPHQLKYGRWRCQQCTRTFIAKEDHVREKLQRIEAEMAAGKISLEKVSEEDRNNDSDEESSESSSTTETHSMHLDVPRHSQDASSDSDEHLAAPKSPRRKRGFDDMVTETTSSRMHPTSHAASSDPKRATATFSDLQHPGTSTPSMLSPPINRKKTKRDEALEQDKVVLRVLYPPKGSESSFTTSPSLPSAPRITVSQPIAINESSIRKHWGEEMIRKSFPQFQSISPPSPGTICPLWMHLDVSSTLFGDASSQSAAGSSDTVMMDCSDTSLFEECDNAFGDYSNTPPEQWTWDNTFDESGWNLNVA